MMQNGNLPELPKGWVWTKMGDVLEFQYGDGLTKEKRNSLGTIPVFGSNGIVGYHSKAITDRPCLIVGRKGSAGEVHMAKVPCWPIDTTYFVYPPDGIAFSFLFHTLSTLRLQTLDKSTAIPGLNRDDAYSKYFPLPPLPEQQRIVAKIEELFTSLDAGIAALKKVKLQLKRYRQSVLKSAFEGKLTQEWREVHKNELEPASVLLERIRQEREKQGKYKELPPLDASALPVLPEGWVWARVGEIAESMKNGIYRPIQFYSDNGIACLRMYNIEGGAIVWKDIKRMDLTPDEIKEYELRPGDILVNRVNSRELVGKAAVMPLGLERCVYESKNIRLRLYGDYVLSKLVAFWFRVYAQDYFDRNAQQTVGMASINQDQLGSMPFPTAPLPEQRQIVAEIERLLSIADKVEAIVDQGLAQSDRLRQSILKRAFEGKLVPQDPRDEPAERILERIRAEKCSQPSNRSTGRTRKSREAFTNVA